jgi:hypothetical protein
MTKSDQESQEDREAREMAEAVKMSAERFRRHHEGGRLALEEKGYDTSEYDKMPSIVASLAALVFNSSYTWPSPSRADIEAICFHASEEITERVILLMEARKGEREAREAELRAATPGREEEYYAYFREAGYSAERCAELSAEMAAIHAATDFTADNEPQAVTAGFDESGVYCCGPCDGEWLTANGMELLFYVEAGVVDGYAKQMTVAKLAAPVERKIDAVRITPMPKSIGDPIPEVFAIFDDGKEESLFDYFPNEISFTVEEFMGLTKSEAVYLKYRKDLAYLQS